MSAFGVKQTSRGRPSMSANDPKRTSQLFSGHVLRCISAGGDLALNDLDVAAQIIQLVGKGKGKMDVTDGLLNALDFGLRFSQMLVRRASVERRFQFLKLGIPIEKTPTVDPIVSQRQKAEHWEAERYGGHQHCNRSLCVYG